LPEKEDYVSNLGIQELIIIAIIGGIGIVAVIPWFFIYKKAGYHPAMGCLMFLPIVNIVMLFVLAFSDWPIERELGQLRSGNRDPRVSET
jgi:uncharacterized membrane protein